MEELRILLGVNVLILGFVMGTISTWVFISKYNFLVTKAIIPANVRKLIEEGKCTASIVYSKIEEQKPNLHVIKRKEEDDDQ